MTKIKTYTALITSTKMKPVEEETWRFLGKELEDRQPIVFVVVIAVIAVPVLRLPIWFMLINKLG